MNQTIRDTTENKILNFIKTRNKARVEDLRLYFDISRQQIHKQLNKLIKKDVVTRVGIPPLVFYEIKKQKKIRKDTKISKQLTSFIDKDYLWVSPKGEMLYGIKGFNNWVESINLIKQTKALAAEYVKTRKKANKLYDKNRLVDATHKIKKTFKNTQIDKVYYLDFYSLPKFGKTRLGQLVLYGKQAQQPNLIKNLSIELKSKIKYLTDRFDVNAVAFIPPTIPRQIQFLKELEKNLAIDLPKISLVKAYSGEIPIAQKTLSKLEQRIENARSTIFIKDVPKNYKTVLLIDDAVGSGASLNETAIKLKEEKYAQNVVGIAIVGSYKGFDVISEI